jgi:hypothetical protein
VRFGVTILGFYLVGDGSIQNMLVCALGFVVARFAVARITRFFPKITENQAT